MSAATILTIYTDKASYLVYSQLQSKRTSGIVLLYNF